MPHVVADTSTIVAVLLDEPERQAIVDATSGSVLCVPASIRWDIGNAAVAAVKKRRLTTARARQLVEDFEHVTLRELSVDVSTALDLALELGLYAYDAYVLEAARSSGYPLLSLDAGVRRGALRIGVPLVELEP